MQEDGFQEAGEIFSIHSWKQFPSYQTCIQEEAYKLSLEALKPCKESFLPRHSSLILASTMIIQNNDFFYQIFSYVDSSAGCLQTFLKISPTLLFE